MNINTTYLNMPLHSPLVVSASPLSTSVENIKRMEDAGAAAIVLFSLFEEQLRIEQQRRKYLEAHPKATPTDAEALYPARHPYHMDLNDYLEHIRRTKEAVKIPIIASLNCQVLGSWMDFSRKIEAAGADALELNIYSIPTSMDRPSEYIEDMYVRILTVVKEAINIPVAVKLTPFFTNTASLSRHLDQAGAGGLVLFNRFYQPDFDPRTLQVRYGASLGKSHDSLLALHWIAILFGKVRADLAATGGILTVEDIVKMLMVGARVTMLASTLLENGIEHLRTLEQGLRSWLDENDYSSVAELQGIISQFHSNDPSAFERTAYIRAITSQGPYA
jgi:dihydroorotate dehydrogenase (fumarate)